MQRQCQTVVSGAAAAASAIRLDAEPWGHLDLLNWQPWGGAHSLSASSARGDAHAQSGVRTMVGRAGQKVGESRTRTEKEKKKRTEKEREFRGGGQQRQMLWSQAEQPLHDIEQDAFHGFARNNFSGWAEWQQFGSQQAEDFLELKINNGE